MAENLRVSELLTIRGLHPIRVAVEINEELVPRKTFDQTTIRNGDRIEIVTFVGGG
ncbi:MAG: sulfur carrier protein ThiS [Planctomycetes bacterium]|nr:sulfur carrier protein ThiS [Planctomycetota bacterium]